MFSGLLSLSKKGMQHGAYSFFGLKGTVSIISSDPPCKNGNDDCYLLSDE